jgi:hypothetical protein
MLSAGAEARFGREDLMACLKAFPLIPTRNVQVLRAGLTSSLARDKGRRASGHTSRRTL